MPQRLRPCTFGNFLLLTLFALVGPAAHAQQTDATCGQVGDAARFAAFHDNYALWHQMRNNGWTRSDDAAVRGQLSLKYSLVGCPQRREKKSRVLQPAPVSPDHAVESARTAPQAASLAEYLRQSELFISYTNRFDFYLGTRDSGPVINRISNPGLHLRLPARLTGPATHRRDAWQISFEHLSDGQVVEPVTNDRDRLRAQHAYERGDHAFFDTISRGMNFVAVQGEWVWKDEEEDNTNSYDLRAKVKHYVSSDSTVTWGPLADRGLRFADYERLTVRLGLYAPGLGRIELTTRIGDRGFKRASHTLGWQYTVSAPAWNLELPLYVQLHRGPMNTLSNYTQRQDSIGVGMRLAY